MVGELGIAAIHCLGIYSGKVERSDNSFKEYDKMKEFFVKLFENSVNKECELILPCDFVTAEKASVASIMGYKEATKAEEVKSSMGDSKLTNSQAALGQKDSHKELANVKSIQSLVGGDGFKPQHWSDARMHLKQT